MFSGKAVLETDVEVRRAVLSRIATDGSGRSWQEALCHARRERAGQISPATFDNLQEVGKRANGK